jgi:hypothetical protein
MLTAVWKQMRKKTAAAPKGPSLSGSVVNSRNVGVDTD